MDTSSDKLAKSYMEDMDMVSERKLKRSIESFQIAAQNNAIGKLKRNK